MNKIKKTNYTINDVFRLIHRTAQQEFYDITELTGRWKIQINQHKVELYLEVKVGTTFWSNRPKLKWINSDELKTIQDKEFKLYKYRQEEFINECKK